MIFWWQRWKLRYLGLHDCTAGNHVSEKQCVFWLFQMVATTHSSGEWSQATHQAPALGVVNQLGVGGWKRVETGGGRVCLTARKESVLTATAEPITYPPSQPRSAFPGSLGPVPAKWLVQVQVQWMLAPKGDLQDWFALLECSMHSGGRLAWGRKLDKILVYSRTGIYRTIGIYENWNKVSQVIDAAKEVSPIKFHEACSQVVIAAKCDYKKTIKLSKNDKKIIKLDFEVYSANCEVCILDLKLAIRFQYIWLIKWHLYTNSYFLFQLIYQMLTSQYVSSKYYYVLIVTCILAAWYHQILTVTDASIPNLLDD